MSQADIPNDYILSVISHGCYEGDGIEHEWTGPGPLPFWEELTACIMFAYIRGWVDRYTLPEGDEEHHKDLHFHLTPRGSRALEAFRRRVGAKP